MANTNAFLNILTLDVCLTGDKTGQQQQKLHIGLRCNHIFCCSVNFSWANSSHLIRNACNAGFRVRVKDFHMQRVKIGHMKNRKLSV